MKNVFFYCQFFMAFCFFIELIPIKFIYQNSGIIRSESFSKNIFFLLLYLIYYSIYNRFRERSIGLLVLYDPHVKSGIEIG